MLLKMLAVAAGILLLGLLLFLAFFYFIGQRKLPEGVEGPEAEALASRIEQAVRADLWNETAAVGFSYPFRGNHHFFDLKRGYWEVRWKKRKENYRVIADRFASFIAWEGQRLLAEEAARSLYFEAYKRHINDLFWLNPFSQLRAPGAKRLYVGRQALLVTYTSGGVTPGDSYLIITDEKGLPQRWQIWASILPLKGVEFTFEGWRQFETGAKLSLRHKSLLLSIDLEEVKTYGHYPLDAEPDRFLLLEQAKAAGTALNAYGTEGQL